MPSEVFPQQLLSHLFHPELPYRVLRSWKQPDGSPEDLRLPVCHKPSCSHPSGIWSPEASSRGSSPPQIWPVHTKSSPRKQAEPEQLLSPLSPGPPSGCRQKTPLFPFLERASGSIFPEKKSMPPPAGPDGRENADLRSEDPAKSPPEGLIKISLFRHSLLFFFPVPPPVNTG